MPARIEIAELPPRVDAVRQAISGPARLATLRYVLDHPASSRAVITAGLGISSGSVTVALRELEQLGYVDGSVDAERRKGRSVLYTAARGTLAADLAAFMAWMLG